MIFGSVCSGIEAASAAWEPLGYQSAFFSEIEPFPCSVLAHHYPGTPNHGDMTKLKEWPDANINVLVGGTPCQSFSVAGLRKGLDDPRGNLMLTFGAIAAKYRPTWLVWENVPGVLSSNGGRDFGSFLGLLGELGYGFAYRILDAQYFGVAQRRRRVFVVAYLGDWRPAAAVLFERHSLSGNTAPSREAREETAGTLASRTGGGGFPGSDEAMSGYLQPVAFPSTLSSTQHASAENIAPSMGAKNQTAVAFTTEQTPKFNEECALTLTKQSPTGGGQIQSIMQAMQVRRLTPRECERLQGFPDDYTQVPHRGKPAADGPRYKALGNSMAVPVMSWIGRRIAEVDHGPT